MQIDPTAESGNESPGSHKPASRLTILLLTLLWLVVLFMRHDFWNWESPRPLLFGFLPVGLWWQALVSFAASFTLALFVRFAWPHHLEDATEPQAGPRDPTSTESKA